MTPSVPPLNSSFLVLRNYDDEGLSAISSPKRFPVETYFDIFAHIDDKRLLSRLAGTSPVFQRPAEAYLYNTVILQGKDDVHELANLLSSERTTRIGAFVRALKIGDGADGGNGIFQQDDQHNGAIVKSLKVILGTLVALEDLQLECMHHERYSSILLALHSPKLRKLNCRCDFDGNFARFLQRMPSLQELHWHGSFAEENYGIMDVSLQGRVTECLHDSTVLPNLHTLATESKEVAWALLQGRPIRNLWISKGEFLLLAPKSRAFVVNHFSLPFFSEQRRSIAENDDEHPFFAEWCYLISSRLNPYGGGLRSLRLDFKGLSVSSQENLLSHLARSMGWSLRTLGFLTTEGVEKVRRY